MLALIGAILGFLGPIAPALINLFQSREDHSHEQAMQKMNLDSQERIAGLNAQTQITMRDFDFSQQVAKGDIDDVLSARAAQPSYGVQVLDALKDGSGGWFFLAVRGLGLLGFTFIELYNAAVRSNLTYLVVGLWMAVKAARVYLYWLAAGGNMMALAQALTLDSVWGDEDQALVGYVVAFYFGQRHALALMGKR